MIRHGVSQAIWLLAISHAAGCGGTGPAGASCWDLDEDAACDLDSEDLDGSGACSVADCRLAGLAGTIAGTVVTEAGAAIEGATVGLSPGAASSATDVEGRFELSAPVGVYALTASAPGHEDTTVPQVSVIAGLTVTLEPIVLAGPGAIVASAGADQRQVGYGATVALAGSGTGAETLDYSWRQTSGPPVAISGAETPTPVVSMPTLDEVLAAIGRELPARIGVFPISHRGQAAVVLELSVTGGGATATDSVTLTAAEPTGSAPVVPLGLNVFVVGAEGPSPSWTLDAPAGSAATLRDADTRTPSFVPDAIGTYTATLAGGGSVTVEVGSWVGVVGRTAECQACHNGAHAPDMFAGWAETPMGTVCSRFLDGALGEYEASCLECHTLGYSAAADNGGFDDVAAAAGWAVPETLQAGTWDDLLVTNAGVARFANVQCESCHGPHESTAHMTGARRVLGAGTCARCHDWEAHATAAYEWERSTHADTGMARSVATVETQGARVGDCARCHSAQGFLVYAERLEAGDASPLPGGEAAFGVLGLTDARVEPVSCPACHDPHEGSNAHQLRLYDAIEMLPSGFGVAGAGTGAVCMACHNSGRGLHDDAHPPSGYEAPEVSAQAEILYGRNAFFVPPLGSGASNHAAIGDSCPACHVVPAEPAEEPSAGGHTFRIVPDLCARCHGEGVDGRAIQAIAQDELAAIREEIAAQVVDELAGIVEWGDTYSIRAWDPATGCYSSPSTPDVVVPWAPLSASIERIDREQALSLVLPEPVAITWRSDGCSGNVTTSTVYVQLGSLVSYDAPVFRPDDTLVKALWNAALLHGDGSLGLHNPGWVLEVLGATGEALRAR
jgi:hypothetical protein